uniref:Putative kunitz domain protein n=1 Tax=Amblyomma cajennense TaxID=34607 RepID=A0A023FT85_AMBCJ
MKFLVIILLSCWSGSASGGDGAMMTRSAPNWPPLKDCKLAPNLEGEHCGYPFLQRRYYFNQTEKKCVLFIPTKCGDKYNQGNNFGKRKGCIRKCIRNSPCLKETWRNDSGPLEGFAYYPPLDICIDIKYQVGAELWPKNNIFPSAEDCQETCAPADKI